MKVLMHKKSSSGIQQARSLLRGILMSLGTIKKTQYLRLKKRQRVVKNYVVFPKLAKTFWERYTILTSYAGGYPLMQNNISWTMTSCGHFFQNG